MSLQLKKLTLDCKDRETFARINDEAFPSSERMSLDEIFLFAAKTNTDVLGAYDENIPVGFAVLVMNDKCGYVYFLAIAKNMRSKGYGGAAIRKIVEDYADLQIILDFEEITLNAENMEQRIRRKNFYLRNGFYETGHYTLMEGERFEVVCSREELNQEGFRQLISVIHTYCPRFLDVLI